MLRSNPSKPSKGFTLIEFVIVIILLGIMAAGIGGFVSLSTQTFVNVSERDELLASARFAIERLNREVGNAVPNSVRIKTDSDTNQQCLEFMPVKASTSYTSIPVLGSAGLTMQVVPFKGEDGNFFNCPLCFYAITVYPLDSSEIYIDVNNSPLPTSGQTVGINAFTTPSPADTSLWTLPLKGNDPPLFTFTRTSPTRRAYVFDDPVAYCVDNNRLLRYKGHGVSQNQSLVPPTPSVLMAENIVDIDAGDLPFTLQAPTLQRNALVQVKLTFERDDEQIVFDHAIHLKNVR
ncbi:type II secretion system protein [Thalassomonas actiniarum]|uniref:Type II secretion system protein n=1 Tax=Thalassomonas actiniarum TaxID=485447 RepID=A0AAE9YN85_9GAMM|nr:type II secretion system protein [Thalassomonas actiniarum]WDD98180.1 type II secretion system protein [Thalassomonas actiniarum]